MRTIIGISGSLRRGSFNTALLRAAAELAPEGIRVEIASIREFPLYDGDLEAEAFPAPVAELKDRIAAADGLLLVTPEYNHSVPGVLKNAIDWLTRPPRDIARVFGDKRVGVIGATPGPGGTLMSQTAWLPILRVLGTHPWFFRKLHLARAATAFDDTGKLVDAKVRDDLAAYMTGFATFVEDRK